METEILTILQAYLTHTGETYDDNFLLYLIDSVIEQYKTQRAYPDDYDQATIQADVDAYFENRKGYVALEVIPAMLGKIGGEGLYSLVDNQVSKNWKYPFAVYLPDVLPFCGVV